MSEWIGRQIAEYRRNLKQREHKYLNIYSERELAEHRAFAVRKPNKNEGLLKNLEF